MKIASNIKFHFRSCGILPLDETDFKNHRFFQLFQAFFFAIFPGLSAVIFFLYISMNIFDFRKSMRGLYVCSGCMNALSLYVYLVLNRRNVQKIFNEVEEVVNESE